MHPFDMRGAPIAKIELAQRMTADLAEADESVRKAWDRIRIEPEKWRCSPWGDETGGFWVVAVIGDQAIWFNDIEGGFNISRFHTPGQIDEYRCSQIEFSEILNGLPEAMAAESFAASKPRLTVPPEVRGRGRIDRRQTTYWVLQPEGRPAVRVHFSGKRETRFVAAGYESIQLTDNHPVLLDYEESWSSLFAANAQAAPADAPEQLQACVHSVSQGWRAFGDYEGYAHVFRDGYGLVMRAPSTIARRAADLLTSLGVASSVVGEWKERGEALGLHVLLLGNSFVIADSFRFESEL